MQYSTAPVATLYAPCVCMAGKPGHKCKFKDVLHGKKHTYLAPLTTLFRPTVTDFRLSILENAHVSQNNDTALGTLSCFSI